MNEFLMLAFLFFCGSLIGWVIEVTFRKFISKSNPDRRWINPGFLTGPYLPLYGFSLCILYLLADLEEFILIDSTFFRKSLLFIIMAICITFIEYIAGLIFIKGLKTKLWDYSDKKFNIQGIICPQFTFFWWVLSAIYYFFIHNSIITSLDWLSHNLSFSFVIGFFYGVLSIDVVNSLHLVVKIRKFANENDIVIIYDKLRDSIHEENIKRKEKINFIFSFKSGNTIYENLSEYLIKELEEAKDKSKEKLKIKAEKLDDIYHKINSD